MEPPPAHFLPSPACGGGRVGADDRAARPKSRPRRKTLPQPLPQTGGERWSRRLRTSSPPPHAGEAGWGPTAAQHGPNPAAPQNPPPPPPASGRGAMEPPPAHFLPSPACGAGRVGDSGRAARPKSRPHRKTLPQPLPQAEGERWSRRLRTSSPPPLAGEAGWGTATARPGPSPVAPQAPPAGGRGAMEPPPVHLLPSPACGGGRVGDSDRAARSKSRPRRKTLPQPLPQAGGEQWGRRRRTSSPPPLAGEAGWGTATAQPGPSPVRAARLSPNPFPQTGGKARKPPPAHFLPSPRLRGRSGGGRRPRSPAQVPPRRKTLPQPLPQALPHAHISHLICIGVWVCALGVVLIPCVDGF